MELLIARSRASDGGWLKSLLFYFESIKNKKKGKERAIKGKREKIKKRGSERRGRREEEEKE